MPTKKLIRKSSLPSLQENANRQPRPTGATYLSLNFQKSNAEEDKDKLLGHLIHSYTINGFRLNGKPLTIMELAKVIQIPPTQIMEHISNISKNMGSLTDPDRIQNTLQTLITLSTTWSIQDRGLVQAQLETMLRSQDGHYKPFISAEVNKSLKLILESNKNLMESYKTFFTSNNTTNNILNVFGSGTPKDSASLLTPEEALKMITQGKGNKALSQVNDNNAGLGNIDGQRIDNNMADSDSLSGIYKEHAIGETPSCLEGRTGTEALMPVPIMAIEPQGLLADDKALQPEDRRNGRSLKRRGIDTDDDDMPNRAD